MKTEPFVNVVTPVYNGEAFLVECIDSVLAQEYDNFDYTIINNRSTDRTLAIAEEYARRDARVRVVTNETFVDVIGNYNNAFRTVSPRAAFVKVVSADDWLVPSALAKMVRLASEHPTIGIVGSLQQSGPVVRWRGLPTDVTVLSGREACRLGLLRGIHVFGTPTSTLYRADLVRRTPTFFPHSESHADTSACYAALHDADFGFVHEVLSAERVHEGQVSARVRLLGADYYAGLQILLHYGPNYISAAELAARREEVLADYYHMLGSGTLKLKRSAFWAFHRRKLNELGVRLNGRRVLIEAVRELSSEICNPATAFRKFKRALRERPKLRH